jgi:hypothetical protein
MKKLTIKEQKLKLLEETVNYYEQDPSRRSINDDGKGYSCAYRIKCEDGTVKKCAVGRLIPDHMYDPSIEGCTVEDLYEEKGIIYKILPKEYSDLGEDFLINLQQLHDFDNYWIEPSADANRAFKIDYMKALINTGEI